MDIHKCPCFYILELFFCPYESTRSLICIEHISVYSRFGSYDKLNKVFKPPISSEMWSSFDFERCNLLILSFPDLILSLLPFFFFSFLFFFKQNVSVNATLCTLPLLTCFVLLYFRLLLPEVCGQELMPQAYLSSCSQILCTSSLFRNQ